MLQLTAQIAAQLRQVYSGGNRTSVNLKDTITDITWEQATRKHGDLNTIGALLFHINYYISAVLKVLEGGPLDAKDKFSFDLPEIQSEEEWQKLVAECFANAGKLAELAASLPEEKLSESFVDEKYGSYYRNLMGLIEHTHYHLGQIVLIKKLLATPGKQAAG